MKEPDVAGGLRVARRTRAGWEVIHEASGVRLFSGWLRLRVYAEQARADLLATGVDWTIEDRREVRRASEPAFPVLALWVARSRQDSADLETGEHYSSSVHYTPPRSLAAAAHYRRALAWARELAEACQDDASRAQVAEVIRSAAEGGELPPWRHRTPLMQWVCDAVKGDASPWEPLDSSQVRA